MRVILARVAVVSILAASAACGGGSTPPATGEPQPGQAPADARPPAAPNAEPPAPAPPAETKPVVPPQAAPAPSAPPAGAAPAVRAPVIVVETSRGTFEFETFPKDAPKTVEHIVELVKRNFYTGQRIHRVEPGFVIQFGDPLSRDVSQQYRWGTGGSGNPVGVAEIKRTHKLGSVAMAHAGNPAYADSQMYVALSEKATKQLDGMYTVFGQVTSGMAVVQQIQPLDTIKKVSVKGAPAKATAPPKP